MANFKIPENAQDISSFDLPLNRTIKLLQWGGDFSGNKLDVSLSTSSTTVDLKVLPDKLPAASTAFTLKGTLSGESVSVSAYIGGSTSKFNEDLTVRVKGEPKKQPGYDVDLLSDLAIKGNAKQVHDYTRIINDPCDSSHILSQDPTKSVLDCGDVAAGYGTKIFSKPASVTYFVYYLPPTSDKMVDLRFDAKRVQAGIDRIKAFLNQGTPVRVWLIHDDGFAKVIQGDRRTHFLTIIGYGAGKFLYLDPWPSGSKFDYDGGMFSKTLICFMGELLFDTSNLSEGIVSPSTSKGLHKYKVIAGP